MLIFSRKSDCLGCAVLLCLVCLFDLACFFLSSFCISHLKTCTCISCLLHPQSGALLSVITLVVLNNPDALFYLIIFPFVPIPAPIVSQPVYMYV